MAQAPQVQSLSDIMAELTPATTGQTNIIQSQKAGLAEKYNTQQKQLDAAKSQSMGTINTQATGRGMSFSGIPLDEQANYLSTTYLPAVANLKTAQTTESTNLDKELADIYANTYKSAYSTQQQQQSQLNSWNLQQAQLEAQARENELNRQAQERENALNRAASAASSAASTPTASQYIANTFAQLGSDSNWRKSGATENSGIIGTLAANYGIPLDQAKTMVYGYRKSVYGF